MNIPGSAGRENTCEDSNCEQNADAHTSHQNALFLQSGKPCNFFLCHLLVCLLMVGWQPSCGPPCVIAWATLGALQGSHHHRLTFRERLSATTGPFHLHVGRCRAFQNTVAGLQVDPDGLVLRSVVLAKVCPDQHLQCWYCRVLAAAWTWCPPAVLKTWHKCYL